jgi:serine/threonine protein kinase
MPLELSKPELQSVSHYELIEKIAEGGMGTVYKGRDQITGAIVAVKVVPPHLLANKVFLKRFEQEYFAARALDHPNIVRALDFGKVGETPFLVMEFVEGESLGSRLDRVHVLPEEDAIRIIVQVAQGLQQAHSMGLVHRDVKPDNILITPSGQAKLTDLGLVKEREADLNLTRTGRGLGTPHFMAPEQFRNAKNADARCDIYSMAATLYMLVTGELPFKSCSPLDAWMKKLNNDLPTPRQLNPKISERVDWAIRRSMHQDPAQRAASCREFIEDLTGQSSLRETSGDRAKPTPADLWYIVYRDEDGVVHTVKGSTESIRQSLRDGVLGDASNIKISHSKAGPYEPLREQSEFRDLVVEPTTIGDSGRPDTTPDTTRALGGDSMHGGSSRKYNAPGQRTYPGGDSCHGGSSRTYPGGDSVHGGSSRTYPGGDSVHSGSSRGYGNSDSTIGKRSGPKLPTYNGKTREGVQTPAERAPTPSPVNIHIPMDSDREDVPEWAKLVTYLLIGLGVGIAGFLLLPKLPFRWF